MRLTYFFRLITKINFLLIFIAFISTSTLLGQTRGAEYRTLDSYTYGRFETRAKPAQ